MSSILGAKKGLGIWGFGEVWVQKVFYFLTESAQRGLGHKLLSLFVHVVPKSPSASDRDSKRVSQTLFSVVQVLSRPDKQ